MAKIVFDGDANKITQLISQELSKVKEYHTPVFDLHLTNRALDEKYPVLLGASEQMLRYTLMKMHTVHNFECTMYSNFTEVLYS